MKDLRANARAVVGAPPERCIALLSAVDGYPSWYPEAVRRAEVTERNPEGIPTGARALVHVAVGPLVRDFDLRLAVEVSARRVALRRIPHRPSDPERFEITWDVADGPATEIRLLLDASLEVPRFIPVGGIGESLAQGFVEAARRALEGSSPNASASSS